MLHDRQRKHGASPADMVFVMEAPMNRILRDALDTLRVEIGPLKNMVAGIAAGGQLQAARHLIEFLAKEENGHLVLSLFRRPGLDERNVPDTLHGAIDLVDRAATMMCCSAVFRDAKHKEVRTYAERHGYASAQDLITAYAAPPAKKKKKK